MHTTPNRVTTIDQLYTVASRMQAPVLIHVEGVLEWSNCSFTDRFGVKTEASSCVKVKELLWCLGLNDAICGMVAEGIPFRRCELPSPHSGDSAVLLKHQLLPMLSDGRMRMMLVLADEFDSESLDICIGGN